MSACTCQPCTVCRGSGTISVDMNGRPVHHRFDDLCDIEMCDECGGSGYADECDTCRDSRERDEAEDQLHEPAWCGWCGGTCQCAEEWTAADEEYFRSGTMFPGQ